MVMRKILGGAALAVLLGAVVFGAGPAAPGPGAPAGGGPGAGGGGGEVGGGRPGGGGEGGGREGGGGGGVRVGEGGGGGGGGGEDREADRREPTMDVYRLPGGAKGTGQAVVIFPGGGYTNLAVAKEGTDVAKVFVEKGVAAFVVR